MGITANDQYLLPAGGSRISRTGFARLLRQLANSAVLEEMDANTFFDIIIDTIDDQGRNPDPLFVLAMFNHESNMGRAGVAVTSKSWGNTRTPNFGATPIGDMLGLSGRFPVWATWQDGLKSTCARLATKDWYYAFEQRTLGEVFRDPHYPTRNPSKPARGPIPRQSGHPIEWAPVGDLNNPAAYLASMLRFMNEHADMEGDQPVGKYPKSAMINYPSPNRDGYSTPRKIELIVNHIGQATKASNLAWLTNPASRASCNAYIDRQGKIYELVPLWSSPWTNGQVKSPDMSNPIIAAIVNAKINPNTRCYTIEHEGDTGDDLTPAQIKANNEVTAWVAPEAGLELSRNTVLGHCGSNC